nr:MauE/DoxX family redox-associated membrane protein [Ensifer aridi]
MPALDPIAIGAAIALLFFVFVRAVLHKVTDFGGLRQTVVDYRLVPEGSAGPVAAGLTGAEILSLALLAAPVSRGFGALAAALLLLGYGAVMAINLARGRTSIDCGCGGAGQSVSWALVGRNMLLAALTAIAAAPVVPRRLGAFDIVLIPTIVVAAGLLLLVSERLVQTFSHIRALGADRRSY